MNKTPSLESLIYRAKTTFKNKMGVENPAIDAFAAAIGGVAFGQYAYSDYLFKQINPETCDEEWLYLHAERLKVWRISLTFAEGTCNIKNSISSATVPSSTILKTSAGVKYEVVTAIASRFPVSIRALNAGEGGNLPAGENLYLVTAVTGLHPESIISNEVSGGAELEELEHWRKRVVLAYNEKNAVGKSEDYKFWAISSHSDIDFAWALDNTPQLGMVTVYIAKNETNPLLSESVRLTAQNYIDGERLAGCHVMVRSPKLKPIVVTVSGGYDLDMRNAVDSLLQSFFTSRIENREPLFSNEISTVISSITNQFTLISPTTTTTFLDSELLTYGGLVWR